MVKPSKNFKEERLMKKLKIFLALLLAMAMVMSMVACGGSSAGKDTEPEGTWRDRSTVCRSGDRGWVHESCRTESFNSRLQSSDQNGWDHTVRKYYFTVRLYFRLRREKREWMLIGSTAVENAHKLISGKGIPASIPVEVALITIENAK